MRKVYNEEVVDAYKEVIDYCNEEDLELVEILTLSPETTDKLDAINILIFRSFNDKLELDAFTKRILAFGDPEFAWFKVQQIEDVIIITSYI